MSEPAGPGRLNGGTASMLNACHRTVGILGLVFVILLAASGLLLNHSAFLGLDKSYLRAEVILDWYGIEAPLPETGYRINDGLLTQVADRLYFNQIPVANAVGDFAGAIGLKTGGINALALDRGLLLLSGKGERIDLLPWPGEALISPDRFGITGSGLPAAQFGEALYALNDSLTQWHITGNGSLQAARSTPLPEEQGKALQRQYKSSVLTWERILLDLHSGRILRGAGVWLADATAVVLLVLGISGSVMWFRRRRRTL